MNKFKRVANKTSMHGLSEISEINNSLLKIMWSLIVIFAFGMTAFQIYRCIDQFVKQPYVTSVTPVKEGEILFPPISICYPHWMYWVDWKKAYSLNFSKPMILYALSFMGDLESFTNFNITKIREELLLHMKMNNITRIKQLYEKIARPFPLSLYQSDLTVVYESTINVDDTRLFCYTLSSEEVSKLVSVNQIYFVIHDLAYKFVQDGISEEEYNYYMMKSLKYYGSFDIDITITKTFSKFGLPWILYPTSSYYIEIGFEKSRYISYLSMSAYRTNEKMCRNGLKMIYGDELSHEFKCNTTYNLKTCSCFETAAAINLEKDYINMLCPMEIKFSENDYSMQIQTAEYERICVENETAKLELDLCIKQIPIACETWHYVYTQVESQLSSGLNDILQKNRTQILLWYPEPNQILISKEIDIQTWELLISNVGGILGIWMGASVLSFFQLIYLICTSDNEADQSNVLKVMDLNLDGIKNKLAVSMTKQ